MTTGCTEPTYSFNNPPTGYLGHGAIKRVGGLMPYLYMKALCTQFRLAKNAKWTPEQLQLVIRDISNHIGTAKYPKSQPRKADAQRSPTLRAIYIASNSSRAVANQENTKLIASWKKLRDLMEDRPFSLSTIKDLFDEREKAMAEFMGDYRNAILKGAPSPLLRAALIHNAETK